MLTHAVHVPALSERLLSEIFLIAARSSVHERGRLALVCKVACEVVASSWAEHAETIWGPLDWASYFDEARKKRHARRLEASGMLDQKKWTCKQCGERTMKARARCKYCGGTEWANRPSWRQQARPGPEMLNATPPRPSEWGAVLKLLV